MSGPQQPSVFLPIDDLLPAAACHRETLYRAVKRGALRSTRLGRVLLVDLRSFREWQAARQLRDSAAQIARGGAA